MSTETFRHALLWSGLINYAMLALWVLIFMLARGFLYRVRRWTHLSEEQLDVINYSGIVLYKVCIWMFFLIPGFALWLVG
jgi:hypothetical protein